LPRLTKLIFLGFLIMLFNCDLTRHSDDVLKRKKIFIEAHRGVTEGQPNHNTKEAILNAIDDGIESFETDAWLTSDKKVVLFHDGHLSKYICRDINRIYINHVHNLKWSELQKCETKEGKYKIPLLEDIMNITKGKIFMNLEIKDTEDEIWEKIQELIEEYEYYDQISICSFNSKFYQKVEQYNNEYNRTIVFGFLDFHPFNINYGRRNHQISLNALTIINNQDIVKKAHDNGMTVGVWFFNEPQQYYNLFEIGIDVIISDYPKRVANQLNEYYLDKISLEGCKSIEKKINNISSCISCQNGYELVNIREQNRNLCKLKYEIDPDLFIKDANGIYQEKNIFAIKLD